MAAPTKIVFDSGAQISGVDETTGTLATRGAATGETQTGALQRGRPVIGEFNKSPLRIVTGTVTFDSNYPTGGEDIAEIWKHFRVLTYTFSGTTKTPATWDLRGLFFENGFQFAGTGKTVIVDYTNKKAKLFTNAAPPVEVANNSDQSTVVVRFIAYGS